MCFHSYGFDKREIPIEKSVFPFPLHFVGHDNKTEWMKKQNLNQHILWSKSNYSKLFCGKSGTFQLFIVLHVWQRFYKRVRCRRQPILRPKNEERKSVRNQSFSFKAFILYGPNKWTKRNHKILMRPNSGLTFIQHTILLQWYGHAMHEHGRRWRREEKMPKHYKQSKTMNKKYNENKIYSSEMCGTRWRENVCAHERKTF